MKHFMPLIPAAECHNMVIIDMKEYFRVKRVLLSSLKSEEIYVAFSSVLHQTLTALLTSSFIQSNNSFLLLTIFLILFRKHFAIVTFSTVYWNYLLGDLNPWYDLLKNISINSPSVLSEYKLFFFWKKKQPKNTTQIRPSLQSCYLLHISGCKDKYPKYSIMTIADGNFTPVITR